MVEVPTLFSRLRAGSVSSQYSRAAPALPCRYRHQGEALAPRCLADLHAAVYVLLGVATLYQRASFARVRPMDRGFQEFTQVALTRPVDVEDLT